MTKCVVMAKNTQECINCQKTLDLQNNVNINRK